MDDLNRYIAENNVSQFFSKLAAETDVAKRVTLSRLLLDEENKFGREAKFLDTVDLYLARCDAQIAKHHALADGNHFPEGTQALIHDILKNMYAIRTVLHSTRRLASERLDKLKGP